MLQFLRKIRRSLLIENKFSKYLLYAIGEILLVVIGILIAIQINSWNNERVRNKEESRILQELHTEFKANGNQLEWVVARHNEVIDYCDRLIQIVDDGSFREHLDSIPGYIRKTFYRATFNPSTGTINSLINTEALRVISDPELRKEIITWGDLLADYTEDEIIQADYVLQRYVPYMSKYFSRTLGFDHPKTDLSFLESIEYEGLLHSRRIYANDILKEGPNAEITKLFEAIDRIIELTDSNE